MNKLSRVGIGAAQFGANYGISNRHGRPSEREIATILARAVEAGVNLIDTAAAYGEAEAAIGRNLPRTTAVRIVTKMPRIEAQSIEAADGEIWLNAIALSLERLRVESVHAVLVHDASDLAKPGWQYLIDALQQARERGWAGRIGASIYNADQLALVESRLSPELVQLPFNALDRRPIESGMLTRLKAAGVEIHARSIFLQGLLLMAPDQIPEFFIPVRAEITELQRHWRGQGLTPLAGCLAFALRQPEIDAVIVGINLCTELNEIIAVAGSEMPATVDIGLPPNIGQEYLDPSCWPAFTS